ncbi:MauE/DoxX family redox-associated membrane protein [Streptomyces sp. NPDC001985]|uniref:MauE/DoxX family redox-associated membrane protein n=1 Tax=Streptomyces sp. NPDC001985 TaxID=3154406 RepID=UPI003328A2C6
MIYVAFACRILLIGVFLTAVAGKARSRTAFAAFERSLAGLGLLPARLSRAVAVSVIAAESATVVLLVPAPTVPLGFALGALLLLGFSAGIALALRRGRRAPCRCFGASAAPLGPVHVVRNLLLAAAGAAGAVLVAAGPADGWPPHPGGAAIACASALVVVVLTVRLDDLTELLR